MTASSLLNVPTPISSPKGKHQSLSDENDVSLTPCASPTLPFNAIVPPRLQPKWVGLEIPPPSPYGYPPFLSPHGYPPSPYTYSSSCYLSHRRQHQISSYSSYTGYHMHSFATTQTVYNSPVSYHPFVLKLITSRISKCQGWKQQFCQAAKQSLNLLHYLIVSQLEQRSFGSAKLVVHQATLSFEDACTVF